jgi:hypothetical protein
LLYIRAEEASLREAPRLDARVLKVLPPSTEVTWLGPDKRNKQFHKVRVEGLTGFVLSTDLAPHKPVPSKAESPEHIPLGYPGVK